MPTLAHASLNTLRYHGLAPAVTAERKPRCRMLAEGKRGSLDRCTNEALSDFGMCAHHLALAAAEFRSLTTPGVVLARAVAEAGGDGR